MMEQSSEQGGRAHRRCCQVSRRRDDGANLVEFALVLPILALFLFGIVQFGIAYDRQQSVNSAAREGARLGALTDTTLEEIGDRAREAYDASASPTDDFTVVVNDGGGTEAGRYTYSANGTETYSVASGDATLMPCGSNPQSAFVEVVVTTPYDITIPFFGVQDVDIDSEAQFRCE